MINKNEITLNNYDFCWRCGRDFNKEVMLERKTYHHAIPQLYTPKFNVKIPICQECHYDINPVSDKIMKSYLIKVKQYIEKYIDKYEIKKQNNIKISDELKRLIKDNKNTNKCVSSQEKGK